MKTFDEKNKQITSFDASKISNDINAVNLDRCGKLITIENLHLLPESVTEFKLSLCGSIRSLPPLPESLTTINLESCKSLKNEMRLHEGVTSLNIFNCSGLKIINFPDTLISLHLHNYKFSINSLPHLLESLKFSAPTCKELPFILTDKITELDLGNCKKLKILQDYLPEGLKKLNLEYCRNLKSLPDSLSRLVNLKILKLNGCNSLTELPPLPEGIEELYLSGCESLTKLPEHLPGNLKILDLSYCQSLTKFPEPLPKNLKILNLSKCISLTELPDPLPEGLEKLDLSGCKSLTKLPEPLPKGIKKLDLSGCKSLTKLPEPLPEGIEELYLSGCESLTKLPKPLPKGIKKLYLSGCISLTELPDPLPEGLEVLTLSDCQKLESLPESISKLRKLKIDDFQNCKSLKEFPVNYHFPNNLKELNLSYCESLTKLPKPLPKNLKILNLSQCKSLTEFPDPLPEGLEKLNLAGWQYLTKLPEPLPRNLKILNLIECKSLTELPNPLPEGLEELNLSGCEKLTHLPESLLNLNKLESLNLSHCGNLSLENIKLLKELEKKHAEAGNVRFKIYWPHHLVDPLTSSCYNLLDQAYLEVNKGNGDAPIYSDKSTLKLFKRFTSENIFQRGNIEEIYDHANKVAKAIKDHPYLLDVLENNSIHYLKECVNQPVMGFVKTAILTDFAVEQDISSKLNIAKRMAIIATIEQEILGLKSQSGNVIGGAVQIELGNAMLREIYNQNKDLIEDKTGGAWKGISKGVTHEETIKGFLTEENIAKVWHKVDNILRDLSDINKAHEYIAEASLNGTHKDFAMIFLGKEGFDERQKELKTLKAQYSEIEDHLSSSAVEISNKIQQIERGENLKEKVDNKIRESLHEPGEDRRKRQKIEFSPGTSPRDSVISASKGESR